ncbi:trigger factor-like [Macadamia integrifolia]|uniref:trigger factor-like n=1 Tax=Macadamia integrifolia TaxID=60698 RepID=UPI001C4EDF90|nr:trigger factor-like [Macadamia integrifolia]
MIDDWQDWLRHFFNPMLLIRDSKKYPDEKRNEWKEKLMLVQILSLPSNENNPEMIEVVTYDLLRTVMTLAIGEQIKEHTSLIYRGSDTKDDEFEFESHEESNEEPSKGDINEEEDDDDDDEDESEDGDDGDDSNSPSDDEYQD